MIGPGATRFSEFARMYTSHHLLLRSPIKYEGKPFSRSTHREHDSAVTIANRTRAPTHGKHFSLKMQTVVLVPGNFDWHALDCSVASHPRALSAHSPSPPLPSPSGSSRPHSTSDTIFSQSVRSPLPSSR